MNKDLIARLRTCCDEDGFRFALETEAADALEEAGRKLALARDALRLAGDEPNLDKARKIADTALAQIGEKQ